MCDDDEAPFYALLLATCQACQPSAKPLTPDAMNLVFDDLRAEYSFDLVKKALAAHRGDTERGQWLPNTAHIRHQIERRRAVAWLSADEAWSRVPKTEGQPGLMNDVTAQALAVAQQFLDMPRPDLVAARMAFKGCYDRLVERAKLERRAPAYFISPGGSIEEQQQVQDEAVRLGLLAPPRAEPVKLLETSKRTPGAKPDLKALLLSMNQRAMPPPEAQDYES